MLQRVSPLAVAGLEKPLPVKGSSRLTGRGGNRRLPPLHAEVREQVPASVDSHANPVGKKYVPPPPPPKPVPALHLAAGLYGDVVRRRSPSPPPQRRLPARRHVGNLSSLHRVGADSALPALPDWDDVCSVQDSEMTQSEGGGEELCSDDPDEYGEAASLLVSSFFFAAAQGDAEDGDTDVYTKDVVPIPKDADAVADHRQHSLLETGGATTPSLAPPTLAILFPQRPLPKTGWSPQLVATTSPALVDAVAPAAPSPSPPKRGPSPKREGPQMPTLDDLLGSPRGPYGDSKASSGRRPHRLEGSSRIPQTAR